MLKTNTIWIFIVSFLVFCGSMFAVWYFYGELLHKIEVVKAHYVEEKQNKNSEFGSQLKSNYELLINQEETLKRAFFNSDEIVVFITQIEAVAESQGLEIVVENLTYGTSEAIEGYVTTQPVAFNIQLNGSYVQIESFLNSIEQSENFLVSKEIKLYKSGEGEGYSARIIIEGIVISS